MANLGKLIKQADAAAESASRLVLRAMREIRGELALLADELNLTGSAADRDKAYQMIQKKMARLSRRLDALMDAQNHLAGKTAAKSAEEMTGLEVKYSAARANAIIELVTPAQGENLAAVFTENMAANSIRALQEATVAVMREQAVAGGTMKEMKNALGERWQKAISAPPVFTDAGGHTWDTGAYLQMNIRTNTMRVYNDCLVDDVARTTGSDLVRVSTGGDPMCRLCAPWEGVILSVSGKTKGFPTYEQARQAGCFHPNCVHTIETVDDVWDGDEIELQKAHPVTKETATDPDAMDERKYKMDQERYRRKGMSADAARLAVDRDNLEANIRHGLIRSDARAIVDKLTDAQVSALCKDGNPPRFEPTKKATKKDPHAADEKWIHGKRGGVVHISRNATVEDLVKVTGVKDVKLPEPAKVEKPKAVEAVEHTIVQGRNLESFVGSPDSGVSLTKQIIQEQGFDGKPLIIDDETEFDRLAKKSGIMGYRGLGDGDALPGYVNDLREGDFYVECSDGGRVHGRGAYFAVTAKGGIHKNSYREAEGYAQKSAYKFKNQQTYIFNATVAADIKIVEEETIRKMRKDWVVKKLRQYTLSVLSESGISEIQFRKFIDEAIDPRANGVSDRVLIELKNKTPKMWEAFEKKGIDFRGIIESDIGTIAAEKGFDAIISRDAGFDGVDYFILLNRTKLILLDKEAEMPK